MRPRQDPSRWPVRRQNDHPAYPPSDPQERSTLLKVKKARRSRRPALPLQPRTDQKRLMRRFCLLASPRPLRPMLGERRFGLVLRYRECVIANGRSDNRPGNAPHPGADPPARRHPDGRCGRSRAPRTSHRSRPSSRCRTSARWRGEVSTARQRAPPSPRPVLHAQHRRAGRVLDLDPALRPAAAVGEIPPLRHDALQAMRQACLKISSPSSFRCSLK